MPRGSDNDAKACRAPPSNPQLQKSSSPFRPSIISRENSTRNFAQALFFLKKGKCTWKTLVCWQQCRALLVPHTASCGGCFCLRGGGREVAEDGFAVCARQLDRSIQVGGRRQLTSSVVISSTSNSFSISSPLQSNYRKRRVA
jgi:hypothetical protein